LIVEKDETMPVRNAEDIVRVRREVRTYAIGAGFTLVDQTKIVTAASEIARNTVDYGGGGTLHLAMVRHGARRGVRLTFTDQGPGIADLKLALTDGYTTGSGLGLGLSGAKRLSSEFDIKSALGEGTMVTMVRWK
jgi:serine/threonine-protein kinase RsbT